MQVTQSIEAKGFVAKTLFSWGMKANWSKFIYDAILFKKVHPSGGR